MLLRGDRGVGRRSGVVNVLSNLFFKMLLDLNVTIPRWKHLMDEYVASEAQQSNSNNRRDRTSLRGNLNKEFIRHRMTWKVFCKAMAFLKLRCFRIVIIAMHEDYSTTEHSYLIDYSTPSKPIPEEEMAKFLMLVPDSNPANRVENRPPPYQYQPFNPVTDERIANQQQQFDSQAEKVEQLDLFD
jgi:hypothetical protein